MSNSGTRKTREQIEGIFYPKSVAVVGSNRVKGTVPHDIFYNILKDNFQGVVYPVSPKEPSISGVKAYKYVIDIQEEVDMAVLVFPSSVCNLAMEQCGQKGVKSMIIISAGFKEVGEVGLKREQEVKAIADKYGISFIGPNCLGVINTDPYCHFNASFARRMPAEGSIAFLSQSGALCTAVLDYAYAKNIGFSKFVSFGNKADVSEIDLLYYLKDDPKTKVILLYLEEVSNGRALMEAARTIIRETGKPILALKSGRTNEGALAAASHTGSLAGSDEVCNAAFKQAGIIRCNTIEEMFNYAIAFSYQPIPASNKIAIITNAGGPGVLATDKAIKEGLTLARFSEETTRTFKKSLPVTANIKNPVDVIGDARADRYNAALSASLSDPDVDGALVILTPQSMTEIKTIAEEICNISRGFTKPVYASFMGEMDVMEGIHVLEKNHIPHYSIPEDMCQSFATTYKFGSSLAIKDEAFVPFSDIDKDAASAILKEAASKGRTYLPEEEAVKVLEAYKLPVLPHGLANSKEEAAALGDKIGYPVVMKVMSEDIVHKFDVGGVQLNINNAEEAKKAYAGILANCKEKMPKAQIKGILVQKMVKNGEEVILGLKRDAAFGHVIMFGLGGIFVEVFKDVSFKVIPCDKTQIKDLLHEIKGFPLLDGIRGRTKKDVESIIACIQRLSQLAVDCPEIKELDINPLIVQNRNEGCYVADTKIML
ncbi:MAG: acetate--CoA ligase family protein [Spirochaetales bacterium]|nr:acetate--CoA ligase family protein [Spirochaetales bacterium]